MWASRTCRWWRPTDRKSTRLNSSHTEIYTLSLHDALPISRSVVIDEDGVVLAGNATLKAAADVGITHVQVVEADRSEEHTSELQSHRDLHSFPTRRSSDLPLRRHR